MYLGLCGTVVFPGADLRFQVGHLACNLKARFSGNCVSDYEIVMQQSIKKRK